LPCHQSARCTVCNHPSHQEIGRALIDGVPLRTLAATHTLSPSALCRHTRHIRHQLVLQQRQAEEPHSFHVSLGCLQESLRVLSLREKVRHSLGAPASG